MPFHTYGTPPEVTDSTDIGTITHDTTIPYGGEYKDHEIPEWAQGKALPDEARIRSAVANLRRKGEGNWTARMSLTSGPARVTVGPTGWAVIPL